MDEETILSEAIKRPPRERAAFLDDVCGQDAALRESVETLLANVPADANFDMLPSLVSEALHQPRMYQKGEEIDGFEIIDFIGSGGMGEVYLAQQHTPVKRRVALKVLPWPSQHVCARFENERQMLAQMNHPNIAKIFDGGETTCGKPYLVMELVQGSDINDFCENEKLDRTQRLELFVRVCEAVQHAHQKSIIHRDLKPSNILVARHEGQPVPHVIDFGIAKLANQQDGALTRQGEFLGTIGYMSPEQASQDPNQIDTRTDIYSLGIVLFELLTGASPFADELRTRDLFEQLRVIKEREAPSLSSRSSPNASLFPRLRWDEKGDLDAILAKALDKSVERRYDTADALADDIKKFLSGRDVDASRPTTIYKLQKFVARNKVASTFVVAICAVLLVGSAGIAWQASRTEDARKQAEDYLAQLAVTLTDFSTAQAQVVTARPDAIERAREALAILEQLTASYPDKLLYKQLKGINHQNLSRMFRENGEIELALDHARLSVEINRLVSQELPDNHKSRQEYAASLNGLYLVLLEQADQESAEMALNESIKQLESLYAKRRSVAVSADLASSYINLADLFERTGKTTKEAMLLYEKGIDLFDAIEPKRLLSPKDLSRLAVGIANLAAANQDADVPLALQLNDRAISIRQKLRERNPLNPEYNASLAQSYYNHGILQARKGDFDSAMTSLNSASQLQKDLIRLAPSMVKHKGDLASTYISKAQLCSRAGDSFNAEQALLQCIDVLEEESSEQQSIPLFPLRHATAWYRIGRLRANRDPALSMSAYEEGIKTLRNLAAETSTSETQRLLGQLYTSLAASKARLGENSKAKLAFEEARVIREKLVSDYPEEISYRLELLAAYVNCGQIMAVIGDHREAVKWFDAVIHSVDQDRRFDSHKQAGFYLQKAIRGRSESLPEIPM